MSKNWVKDYFTFTFKERIGILSLLCLISAVFLLPELIPSQNWKPAKSEIASFDSVARLLQHNPKDTMMGEGNVLLEWNEPLREDHSIQRRLFPFDPNTASSADWKALGIKGRTITTIQRYLARGGRFRKPEDLKKIYGFGEAEYLALKPYVQLPNGSTRSRFNNNHTDTFSFKGETKFSQERHSRLDISLIELNTTDTTALILLPGIGSKLANRIINFRERLGGFYSIDQVSETYGLSDSTFQLIRPYLTLGNKPIVRININTAEALSLKQHPYISWTAANALVEYRRQHGPFQRVEDISRISAFLPEQLKRLIPYLSID